MYFNYSKKQKVSPFYPLGKILIKLLAPFVYDVKCKGAENIPLDGPLIIAGNHISSTDPAAVIAFCPRVVHFMAKSELFESIPWAVLVRSMNAFPVKRNYSDRDAIRYADKILKKGWVVGIFPEGRRVKELIPTEAKQGVAYIARRSGADVLPVCLYRSPSDKKLRHSLTVRFGKIIKNSDLGFEGINRSNELKTAADRIMDEIKTMWEEEHGNSYG